MPITYSNAIDEMYGMINAAVNANSVAIINYIPEIRWPGNAKADEPDITKYWMRVSSQIVKDSQSALVDTVGSTKFTAIGLLYVQLFCPRNLANTVVKGRQLAETIRDRFREKSPSESIWFRDQKIVELGETPESYPINVVVTFEYDTVK